MKIKIRKIKSVPDEWDTDWIYEIQCFCGVCLYSEDIPEWFECPGCNRKISLFKKYVKFKKGKVGLK